MKIRDGFVSNSSSSCFILDAERIGPEMTAAIRKIPRPCGLGRGTAAAVGTAAVKYAFECKMDSYADELGDWILEWARKLGEKNVVFIRESDEGMGAGYLSDHGIDMGYIKKRHAAEMEYH